MSPVDPQLIGQAVTTLLAIVPKLVDLGSELAKGRVDRDAASRAVDQIAELRKSLSSIGEGLDAYVHAYHQVSAIETESKTLRDFLDGSPALAAGSDKWTTVSYMFKSLQDQARYYDTLLRNPQGLFEKEDLLRVESRLDDFRAAQVAAEIHLSQQNAGELKAEVRNMVAKSGQVAQIFRDRIDTALQALKQV